MGSKSGKHTLELRVVASDHETELDAKDQIYGQISASKDHGHLRCESGPT